MEYNKSSFLPGYSGLTDSHLAERNSSKSTKLEKTTCQISTIGLLLSLACDQKLNERCPSMAGSSVSRSSVSDITPLTPRSKLPGVGWGGGPKSHLSFQGPKKNPPPLFPCAFRDHHPGAYIAKGTPAKQAILNISNSYIPEFFCDRPPQAF